MKCNNCDNAISGGEKFCPECGSRQVLECAVCGFKLQPNTKFCPECGTQNNSSTPSVDQSGQTSGSPQVSGSPVLSMPGQGAQAESGIILSNGEKLLNRFIIKKSLGRGGFGAVYLAEDGERKQDIALKVVTTNVGQAEMAAMQIRNELTLRDKINDFTHIIRTYDIHIVDAYKGLSLILMPMEYAEGNSFRNFLTANKRDDENRRKEGVDLFKQACKGVKAIHDAGLVHCDLKPENILICKDHKRQTVAKVSDFGISRNVDQWSMNQAAVIQSSLGTPYYMSPEQVKTARQKDIDGRADIYALGVILFEILDGDPPFDGTADEVRKKHLEMKPPKLKGIDEEYVRAVYTCLEKDPEKRYQGIEELIAFKSKPNKKTEKRKKVEVKPKKKESSNKKVPPKKRAPRYKLRSTPKVVSYDESKIEFGLDSENKPHVYINNEYEDNGDGTITDHATGLMWQQSSSGKVMTYESALGYVKSLNRSTFVGYSDWRLPTVEELISLLTEDEQDDVYVDDIFDTSRMECWSADKENYNTAWYGFFICGSVQWRSIDHSLYVLAVRSVMEEGTESSPKKRAKAVATQIKRT
jgi:eukaryotic-like serine/threonine-protein kinase